MFATTLMIAAIAGIIVVAQKSCRPMRGPGVAEAREVLHHVFVTAQNLQVVELPAASMLDLYGFAGYLGAVESEDATSLRAVAKVPKRRGSSSPEPGHGRGARGRVALRPAARTVSSSSSSSGSSSSPGPRRAGLPRARDAEESGGARWPVRVRVRFGEGGGSITRIAAYRDGPAVPASSTVVGRGARASASTAAPAGSETSAAPPEPASSGLLPQCPSLFENLGAMAVGESRSYVCTRDYGIGVRENGRYGPSSSSPREPPSGSSPARATS